MTNQHTHDGRPVVALSGGVGGAKLALGLSRVLAPESLMIIANTGDDFEHLGLHISPDIDTLTYVLASLDNPHTGWGRRDETWSFMDAMGEIGGETWFKLGDRDLAIHVERTRRLRAGEALSTVTADIARRLNIRARIVPMSDDRVRTQVISDRGVLGFQDYFVRLQCVPVVRGFVFEGSDTASSHPDFLAALTNPLLRAVVICPSNPFISIDPILAMPGVRAALAACGAPVIAVSPIIAGRAVKGPTAKMFQELGFTADAAAVAEHYRGVIDGYVLDKHDAGHATALGVRVDIAPTLMHTLADREYLAHRVLYFADRVRQVGSVRNTG